MSIQMRKFKNCPVCNAPAEQAKDSNRVSCSDLVCIMSFDSLFEGVWQSIKRHPQFHTESNYLEEGDRCEHCDTGVMEYRKVLGCTCHISPPCHNCVTQSLFCSECDYEQENDNE